jgi:hypothetical protein
VEGADHRDVWDIGGDALHERVAEFVRRQAVKKVEIGN